ncbi:hypothetical protein [Caballeronia sp. LZ035]|uniref:hypothetical protein n=1 Tax=Caballeronia sp. LZ035 TaxID=3038568 RepID=UPI00285C99B1|nr:hypothetical protein [Caballeronia sp. LZ035]MDR5756136.1 hypothetical protein [Caballeronia sp. LZ035]
MKSLPSSFGAIALGVFLSLSAPLHATAPGRWIESSDPPYVARVADGALLSIQLQPVRLKLDMNAHNSVRSETDDFKPARYSFPRAHVPQAVLHRLTDIYRYERRRDVPIVSSGGNWVIAEYFPAHSHIPVARFQLLGGRVQRQERLDRNGRTTQIVVIGWARVAAPADEEASDLTALGERPAWIRVFRVSPSGSRTLVAVARRKRSFTAPPHPDDVPHADDLTFGSAKGAPEWRSMAEFAAAQDIDLDAAALSGKSETSGTAQRAGSRA